MHKQVKKYSSKALQSPGEGRYLGDSPESSFQATLISYDETGAVIQEIPAASPLPRLDEKKVHWLQIKGLSQVHPVEFICHLLRLHPLTIEDVFNTYHPAKFEEYPEYLLMISHTLCFNPQTVSLESRHITMIMKKNLLVSFQDADFSMFQPILSRIETGAGRIRSMPVSYLLYRVIDLLVDQAFLTIEGIWEAAETIDKALTRTPDKHLAEDIQHLKREMLMFMKSLRPLRQAVGSIIQSPTSLFPDEIRLFLRDVHDNLNEITELTDTLYAYLIESYNMYLSLLSQKTNETMRILTAIATIFIPLTFIVGVYGMNFQYMPEYAIPYAYPVLWGIMLSVSLGMVLFFKRKKWF